MKQPESESPKGYKNTGLFVDYFLDKKLADTGEWREALADPQTATLFQDLNTLFVCLAKLSSARR